MHFLTNSEVTSMDVKPFYQNFQSLPPPNVVAFWSEARNAMEIKTKNALGKILTEN